MDSKSLELYHEEQRQKLIDLGESVGELKRALEGVLKVQEANPTTEVKVSGEVVVNTEKAVEITNIGEFIAGVDKLAETLAKAIGETFIAPPTEITVKNIKDAQTSSIEVKNFADLKTEFEALTRAIESNTPVINVEKQTISWPTSAKDAIPVRLSDGKSFYKAIVSAFSGGVSASLATDIANAIAAVIGGSSTGIGSYTIVQKDTTSDSVNYKYYGYVKSDGSWAIKRVTRSNNYAEFKLGTGGSSFGSGFYAWVSALTGYQAYEDAF